LQRQVRNHFVRGGVYFFDKPLIILPGDSGLTVAAFRGEKPVMSGGRRITHWKQATVDGRKLWVADVPELREANGCFGSFGSTANGQCARGIQTKAISPLLNCRIKPPSGPWDKRGFVFTKAI